jgi:TPR repeat protein
VRSAAHYLKLAADQGDDGAQINYRNCLQNGKGVSIDMRSAVHYFKLAADQGLAEAVAIMGYVCSLVSVCRETLQVPFAISSSQRPKGVQAVRLLLGGWQRMALEVVLI